ncbi:hypothetical protein AO726_20235 [Pseudomonas sp. TTU2014-080ASC]|nr:hypothetical protein AO726_20235 [Pseudomonas sp. TTU2014-080ASC]
MTVTALTFKYLKPKHAAGPSATSLKPASRKMGLGPYPTVSLIEARQLAADHRKTLATGQDPLSARGAHALFGAVLPSADASMDADITTLLVVPSGDIQLITITGIHQMLSNTHAQPDVHSEEP